MHRFRKRSDVKRADAQAAPAQPYANPSPDTVLPPISDFRTSLILPDLSRRFSLLRTPAGEPVTVNDLRTKFAHQRAKGSQHTISEEEEDMLLETLKQMRRKDSASEPTPERSPESITGDFGLEDESGNNSSTTIKGRQGPSELSTPTTRANKRYSNNLFGSGRLRDYTYMRSVAAARSSQTGSSKTLSLTPSEASSATGANTSSVADSPRPSTPLTTSAEELSQSISNHSTPVVDESAQSTGSVYPDHAHPISAAEYRLAKQLGPAVMKRASLALESAIKEIEDEVEEEIVMPRSTPIPRLHSDYQHRQLRRQLSQTSTHGTGSPMLVVEEGMAISSDKPDAADMHLQRGPSPIPLNATPGYIPGMPRPMTPRDFDIYAEDQRSHSTTPKATSPNISLTLSEPVSISNLLRRDSTSSAAPRPTSRPTTPLFLNRSPLKSSSGLMNGRHTPVDDRSRHHADPSIGTINPGQSSIDAESPRNTSALSGRKRPASPLSKPLFQYIPSTSPQSVGYSISRPTTPSKNAWRVKSEDSGSSGGAVHSPYSPSPSPSTSPASPSPQNTRHRRNDSWLSDGAASDSDLQSLYEPVAQHSQQDVFGHVGLGLGTMERRPSSRSHSPANGVTLPAFHSSRSRSPSSSEDIGHMWSSIRSGSSALGRPVSPLSTSVTSQTSFTEAFENGPHSRSHRSGTPTQVAPRSTASTTFGAYHTQQTSTVTKRSSQQTHLSASSPFNLGPLPSFGLNTRGNMSTSSLESTGSSFHSWAESRHDKILGLFTEGEASSAWHDLSNPSLGRDTPGTQSRDHLPSSDTTSPDDDWEPEETIRRYAGLKKQDFAVIQEKLVAVARNFEHRGSALRKRRPSTSQSNYSFRDRERERDHGRVASPPASPVAHLKSSMRDQQQQAVQQQQHQKNTLIDEPPAPLSAPGLAPSPSTSSLDSAVRNRNLTKVLFGEDEPTNVPNADSTPTIEPVAGPANRSNSPDPVAKSQIAESTISELLQSAMVHAHSSPRKPSQPLSPVSPIQSTVNRSLSTTRAPQSSQEHAALAREVEQRIQVATLALRKPSLTEEILPQSPLPKKRVDTRKISGPTLVSASTSVDTIPLRTPSLTAGSSGGSKIGSRFKRLRGSIRGKPLSATIEENASIKLNSKGSSLASFESEQSKGPHSAGLPDSGKFKHSVASPPASAGPGLKGFMARFRPKRVTEIPQSATSSSQSSPRVPSATFSTPPASASSARFPETSTVTSSTPISSAALDEAQGRPQTSSHRKEPPAEHPDILYADSTIRPNKMQTLREAGPPGVEEESQPYLEESGGDNADALLQLYAAASKFGLDQTALNDLLVRSGSVSTKTLLTRAGSTSRTAFSSEANPHTTSNIARLAVPQIQQPNLSSSSGSDHTATPAMFATSLASVASQYGSEEVSGSDDGPVRRPSVKQAPPEHLRRRKEPSAAAANQIIRRTVIFVDPKSLPMDAGMQRKASTKRRRVSVQSSASNRSVHERVPTPPPPKTPTGRRFSNDNSPPVPHLPQSYGGPSDNFGFPVANDKQRSNHYDSFYELYGESRAPSAMAGVYNQDSRGDIHGEPGTGVEVIELANGETIWKIVNGLRDDEDDASVYTGRNSFSSEYSGPEGPENLQVFVKEHVRSGSKGSTKSGLFSRKKAGDGKPRPETKIMYSSPEHVAHLIEQLSHGMDAGSFNFAPYRENDSPAGPASGSGARQLTDPGHSASSSVSTGDVNWAMQEIDHMLTTMAPQRK